MKLEFEYNAKKIEFDVILRKRKTIAIKIEPPNIITVIAPLKTPKNRILEIVESKANWIEKKLSELSEIGSVRIKEFVNGESFLYLGSEYFLQVIVDAAVRKAKTELCMNKLYVSINEYNPEKIKSCLEAWYRQNAQKTIMERVAYYQSFFDTAPRKITVKAQKKRWGSCNSKHDLFFNWRCIMAPLNVLDYVVVHEMCHMIHLNHSSNFWKLVGTVFPDYQESRDWLKKNGMRLNF